jgi:hypothetical protein
MDQEEQKACSARLCPRCWLRYSQYVGGRAIRWRIVSEQTSFAACVSCHNSLGAHHSQPFTSPAARISKSLQSRILVWILEGDQYLNKLPLGLTRKAALTTTIPVSILGNQVFLFWDPSTIAVGTPVAVVPHLASSHSQSRTSSTPTTSKLSTANFQLKGLEGACIDHRHPPARNAPN